MQFKLLKINKFNNYNNFNEVGTALKNSAQTGMSTTQNILL